MAPMTIWIRSVDLNESRQGQILRDTLPLAILATLAVIGRFVSRYFRKAALGADDYTIVVALIFTWGRFALGVIGTYVGLGKHTESEPKGNKTRLLKILFAGGIIYPLAITAIKASILLLYQRMFDTPKFVLSVRIIGAVVAAWCIAVVLVQIFDCNPIHGFWDTSTPSTCIDGAHFYIGSAVPNILTDVIILVLPIHMVWRLQTSLAQKIALSFTFLTGAFVIVASLYRVFLLHVADRKDPLWSYTYVVIWTSIEPSVGVVCACLPTMRPLLMHFLSVQKSFLSSIRSKKDRSGAGQGIQLESSNKIAQILDPSNHAQWTDESSSLRLGGYAVGESVVEPGGTDPSQDDKQTAGINVQHEVHVERCLV